MIKILNIYFIHLYHDNFILKFCGYTKRYKIYRENNYVSQKSFLYIFNQWEQQAIE